MTSAAKSNLRGILFALLAFGLFATHDAAVKSLGGVYASFQIVFFSVVFSFPLVTLMLMRDARAGTLIPAHPWWTALRTATVVVTAASGFYAFSVLPLAETYAILFAAPLVITILSIPILGEKVGFHRWAAVFVGLIGVLIVLRPLDAELSLGHVAAIIAAVGGGLGAVIVRKIGKDERSAVLLLYPMMANFVIMGALLPFVYEPMPMGDLGLTAVVALFAFGGGLGVIAAYRAGDAAIVAPMQYSQILWAALYGWVFFGEAVDLTTGIGAAVVILSGVYIVLRESVGGRSEQQPVLETRSRLATPSTPRLSVMAQMADKDD